MSTMGTVTEQDSIVPTQVEAAGQSRGGWVGEGWGVGGQGQGMRQARQEYSGRRLRAGR